MNHIRNVYRCAAQPTDIASLRTGLHHAMFVGAQVIPQAGRFDAHVIPVALT
jgi:hypothetical protein